MSQQNYYEEIIIKIDNLINDKQYQTVYNLCREELEMPYIPREIELKLIDRFKQVNAILIEKKANINVSWTLEQIEEILMNPFDEEIHLVAFQYLKDQNIRKILPTIKKYLMNSLYRNETKVHLLFLLKEQEINEPIKIKKTNGVFTIIPKEIVVFEKNSDVLTVIEYLNKYIYSNNPSLFNICMYVLQNYFYAVFPNFIISNNDHINLAASIIYKGYQLFSEQILLSDIQEILVNEIINLININSYLEVINQEQIV